MGHSGVVMTDTSVLSAGYNNYGQLGLNDTVNRSSFESVILP